MISELQSVVVPPRFEGTSVVTAIGIHARSPPPAGCVWSIADTVTAPGPVYVWPVIATCSLVVSIGSKVMLAERSGSNWMKSS